MAGRILTPAVLQEETDVDADPQQVYQLSLGHFQLISLEQALSVYTKLRSLDLSFNRLQSCSDALKPLRDLRELKLNGNMLTELPDLSRCANLQTLQLSHNNISDLHPGRISHCRKLETLWLQSNCIESFPGSVCPGSVTSLDVSENPLVNFEGVSTLTNMRELCASHCGITSSILSTWRFGRCTSLESLDLSGNALTTCISDGTRTVGTAAAGGGLASCCVLEELHLEFNRLTHVQQLPALKTLKELFLSGNRIASVEGLASRFPLLTVLETQDNDLSADVLPALCAELALMTQLEELVIHGNEVAEVPAFDSRVAAACPSLTTLDETDVRPDLPPPSRGGEVIAVNPLLQEVLLNAADNRVPDRADTRPPGSAKSSLTVSQLHTRSHKAAQGLSLSKAKDTVTECAQALERHRGAAQNMLLSMRSIMNEGLDEDDVSSDEEEWVVGDSKAVATILGADMNGAAGTSNMAGQSTLSANVAATPPRKPSSTRTDSSGTPRLRRHRLKESQDAKIDAADDETGVDADALAMHLQRLYEREPELKSQQSEPSLYPQRPRTAQTPVRWNAPAKARFKDRLRDAMVYAASSAVETSVGADAERSMMVPNFALNVAVAGVTANGGGLQSSVDNVEPHQDPAVVDTGESLFRRRQSLERRPMTAHVRPLSRSGSFGSAASLRGRSDTGASPSSVSIADQLLSRMFVSGAGDIGTAQKSRPMTPLRSPSSSFAQRDASMRSSGVGLSHTPDVLVINHNDSTEPDDVDNESLDVESDSQLPPAGRSQFAQFKLKRSGAGKAKNKFKTGR